MALTEIGNGIYQAEDGTRVSVALKVREETLERLVFDVRAIEVDGSGAPVGIGHTSTVTHMSGDEIRLPSDEPEEPPEGQAWRDGETLKLFDGGAWVALGPTKGASDARLQFRARFETWRRQAARAFLARRAAKAAAEAELG